MTMTLITDLVRKEGIAIGRVCPSVCFHVAYL